MAVRVSSHTTWTIHHGEQHVIAPDNMVQMVNGEPFFRLSSTNRSLVKLVAAGHVDNFQGFTNPSLAGSTGLKLMLDLRNAASGLGVQPQDPAHQLMDPVPGASPKRKPKRARRSGLPAEAYAGDCDEVVSFQVGEHGGLVVAKKAAMAAEDLVVAMTSSVLDVVFSTIISHGLVLDAKKSYTKSGRFSKPQHPKLNHDTAESELSPT